MKIVFLDAETLGKDMDFSPLAPLGELRLYPSSLPGEVETRTKDCDVILVNKVRCDESTLGAAPSVRLICETATGYDNIDLDFCRAHGIAVCNVANYSSGSVAQVTVAMALSLWNRLPVYDRYTKSGAYTAGGAANCLTPVYREIAGKCWGIFGCGHIGTSVAQVAAALGCRVIVCQRTKHILYPTVTAEELCREADIISLHVPLTKETRGMIHAHLLSLMKPTALLINMARGGVWDETAVAKAVSAGKLGGIGCDVYDGEPMSAQHPFRALFGFDNVILTPHMSWGAYEARRRCLDETCENIRAFLAGQRHSRVD